MHPGADPVNKGREAVASRVRENRTLRGKREKAESLLKRVEPRILSSLNRRCQNPFLYNKEFHSIFQKNLL